MYAQQDWILSEPSGSQLLLSKGALGLWHCTGQWNGLFIYAKSTADECRHNTGNENASAEPLHIIECLDQTTEAESRLWCHFGLDLQVVSTGVGFEPHTSVFTLAVLVIIQRCGQVVGHQE